MKDVTNAKGLGELRTAISHHINSKPPRRGTAFLDLYALSMEKQRLETELSRMMEKRRKRIHERLGEIHKAMDKLVETAQRERVDSPGQPAEGRGVASISQPTGQLWKKMPVEY